MEEIEKLRRIGAEVFEAEDINRIIEILDEAVEKDIITDYFFDDENDLYVLTTEQKAYVITAEYNKTYDTLIVDIIEIPVEEYFEIRKQYVFE